MPADDYLEFRSRLGLALFALGRLAGDVAVKPPPAEMINSLVAGLKDPFTVVVAGEVNAGKSMLLNALFGEQFCATSELPATGQIQYFRHGTTRQIIPHAEGYEEVRLPLSFLHDYHVVDTPGVNSVAEGHELITEKFLPRADVVLFVLPIMNPWGRRSWEFLGRIQNSLGKRIVLVLQQIDVRSDLEISSIVEHVKVCSAKWLGRVLPVFPVSARKALLARTSGLDKVRLMEESRLPALERQLNEIVRAVTARKDKLRNTLRMGRFVLTQIHGKLAENAGRLSAVTDRLRKIQQEISKQQKQSNLKADEILSATIRTGLGVPASALAGDQAWIDHWQKSAEGIHASLASQAVAMLNAEIQQLWKQTRPSLEQGLGHKLGKAPDLKPDASILENSQTEIRQSLFTLEKLEPVRSSVEKARLNIWRITILLTLAGLAALAAGLLNHLPWLIAAGAAVVPAAMGTHWALRKRLNGQRGIRLKALGNQLASEWGKRLESGLHQWIQQSYQHFGTAFKPLFELYERRRSDHLAWVNEAESAGKTLEGMGRELGA